ncbi:hypothetical protein L916_14948 [Plasmopara halstedii]|uniref:VPS9 domain-containing protein n=1 Tax=Plasmopara halstedii TaxID=4781 RepID=A0A0P1B3L0_PLAHL|nr:hypothetical protein L916_14948 [Plasmopara halstedii]CEG48905.1 hypothetical protein L916_14948 [Plasmopara halstedii]|eukprot:XP_024585274.1 hypothetical protein L916_14948 [Plasmopara halstedii]
MAVSPVSRADSGPLISARDASYWMSVACTSSSSHSNIVPSVSASSSSRSINTNSFLLNYRNNSFLNDTTNSLEQHDNLNVPQDTTHPHFENFMHQQNERSHGITLDHHSESNRQTFVTEEVYEYQRYHMVLGWGSKGHLLPLDPDKYMRVVRHGLQIRKRQTQSIHETENDVLLEWTAASTFPDISLPDPPLIDKITTTKQRSRSAASSTKNDKTKRTMNGKNFQSPRWEWASPWHLETFGNSHDVMDGWQYASSFSHFRPRPLRHSRGRSINSQRQAYLPLDREVPSSSPFTSSGKRLRVRRRKWVRYRRLRSGRKKFSNDTITSAFDDAFLDSMSGWLRKRGHVCKNWKDRYFVLHKSVLRYYSDACCTKLKGEVLLFHPQTCVHYVDVHVTGGRDASFAIQVGSEYTLLLQAERLSDRENWMYCIEDALLCRDSYQNQQVADGGIPFDLRESVAKRRLLSAESMALNGNSFRDYFDGINHAHRATRASSNDTSSDRRNGISNLQTGNSSGSDVLHLWASLHAKPGGVLSAVSSASPTLRALLRECDQFLASKTMRQHIANFLVLFRRKYERPAVASVSAIGASAWTRLSEPWALATGNESDSDQETREGSLDATLHVTNLQDARSLLALKNYRFFLERSLELIMDHVTTFANSTLLQQPGMSPLDGQHALRDDEWALARRAALYKLERRTFIPLQEIIYQLLGARTGSGRGQKQEEEQFERLRQRVASYPQSFFEIRPTHQSPSEWQSAIALLNTMDNYSLPSEKAAVLVEVARCIYETYAREHNIATNSVGAQKQPTMAADDFLPIFIFILARCRLRSVIVARHIISETMITALMIGETGYYATMLEAAIGYIASFDDTAKVDKIPSRCSGSGATTVGSF